MVCLVPKTVRRCPDESSDALSDAAGLLTGPAPAGPFLARAPMQPFYSVSSMSNVVKAHLGLILSYVIWAVNYPLYKVIMPHYISPYAMTMLVVGVAALLAFGSMLFVPIEPVRRQDILKLVAAAALMGIAKKLFLMVGIQHTSPIDASIITTSLPILTLIIAAFYLKEPVTGKKITGIVFGATGAILLVMSGQQLANGNASNIRGDLLCLTAQLCFSIYLVFFRGLINRYSPITIMKWMFTGSTLSVLPFTYDKILAIDWAAVEWRTLAGIAFVVVGGTFISYLLVSIGQKRLRPTVVSMYNYIQPIAAAIVAILWGMDSFTFLKTIAVILIFSGVYLVTQSKNLATIEKEIERVKTGEK